MTDPKPAQGRNSLIPTGAFSLLAAATISTASAGVDMNGFQMVQADLGTPTQPAEKIVRGGVTTGTIINALNHVLTNRLTGCDLDLKTQTTNLNDKMDQIEAMRIQVGQLKQTGKMGTASTGFAIAGQQCSVVVAQNTEGDVMFGVVEGGPRSFTKEQEAVNPSLKATQGRTGANFLENLVRRGFGGNLGYEFPKGAHITTFTGYIPAKRPDLMFRTDEYSVNPSLLGLKGKGEFAPAQAGNRYTFGVPAHLPTLSVAPDGDTKYFNRNIREHPTKLQVPLVVEPERPLPGAKPPQPAADNPMGDMPIIRTPQGRKIDLTNT